MFSPSSLISRSTESSKFHQVVRAATPIFTTCLSWYLFNAHFSQLKLASLVPVMIGVGLATCGDYYFTFWGFFLTVFGTLLASLKTIVTHFLQTSTPPTSRRLSTRGPISLRLTFPEPFCNVCITLPEFPVLRLSRLQLHPLDLLARMSPLAFIQCVFYAYMSGEMADLRSGAGPGDMTDYHYARRPLLYSLLLLANGAIAFALNVVSFQANKRAGALSMGVAGV